MFRRVPKRFSLRGVFVVITVTALALVGFRDWLRVQSAREEYDYTVAQWQFQLTTFMNTVAAADKLYEVESATLWSPWRTAARWQVKRLNYLVGQRRANQGFAMGVATHEAWERAHEQRDRECDEVDAKATKLAASAGIRRGEYDSLQEE